MFDKLYALYDETALHKMSSISSHLNNLLVVATEDLDTDAERDQAIDALVEILRSHRSRLKEPERAYTSCC